MYHVFHGNSGKISKYIAESLYSPTCRHLQAVLSNTAMMPSKFMNYELFIYAMRNVRKQVASQPGVGCTKSGQRYSPDSDFSFAAQRHKSIENRDIELTSDKPVILTWKREQNHENRFKRQILTNLPSFDATRFQIPVIVS